MEKLGSPVDLKGLHEVISALCMKHKVTESVASWQLQHGASSFSQDALAQMLDQIVPHR
jgi:hypothetical protein